MLFPVRLVFVKRCFLYSHLLSGSGFSTRAVHDNRWPSGLCCVWQVLDIIIDVFNNKGDPSLDIPPPASECPLPPRITQWVLTVLLVCSVSWQLSWSALCPDSCPGLLYVLSAVLVSSVSWQLSWSALCPDSCPGLLYVLSAVLVCSMSCQLSWSALCPDSCPGQLCVLTAVLVSSVSWQLSWSALCTDWSFPFTVAEVFLLLVICVSLSTVRCLSPGVNNPVWLTGLKATN